MEVAIVEADLISSVWTDTAKLANMVIAGFGQSKAVEQRFVCWSVHPANC